MEKAFEVFRNVAKEWFPELSENPSLRHILDNMDSEYKLICLASNLSEVHRRTAWTEENPEPDFFYNVDPCGGGVRFCYETKDGRQLGTSPMNGVRNRYEVSGYLTFTSEDKAKDAKATLEAIDRVTATLHVYSWGR
jgi:hypothetical protein